MYNLPYFKEKDDEAVLLFMQEHPFVFLTGADAGNKPVATQIPVFTDEKDGKLFLTGHIMRNTDHHKAFVQNPEVLAVFTGPHTYVSGSWYAGDPQQASTWNYISVHARGRVKWMDEARLIELLRRLTLHFENNNTASSTIYDNLPADYTSKLIKAIIGFEMEVTELENVHKLSQNRDQKSYENIIVELEKQDKDGKYIAERMRRNTSEIFKKQ
jgi:transcriptional regulator